MCGIKESIFAGDFLRRCRVGLSGSYLFIGSEEYLKHSLLKAAREALLSQDTEPFNHTVISASEDKNWSDSLAAASGALPVFAETRLTELHSLDYTRLSESALSDLCSDLQYLGNDRSSVLILYTAETEFDAGRLPKAPSKQYKAICEYAVPVICERETGARLAAWVEKHFSMNKVKADRATVTKLVDYCSQDMYALASEIDKLSYYTIASGHDTVSADDIPFVCCPSRITGAFDFSNALLERDAATAIELLTAMKARRERPEIILSGIVECFSGMYTVRRLADSGMTRDKIASSVKMHEYRVGLYLSASARHGCTRLGEALGACLEADIKIKSTPADSYVILDRLVISLLSGISLRV